MRKELRIRLLRQALTEEQDFSEKMHILVCITRPRLSTDIKLMHHISGNGSF